MEEHRLIQTVRWRVAAMLFLAGGLNYLDRSALAVAAPAIQSDLGLSSAALGFVFSAFFLGYALFNFVGGWAADRFRAHRVLSLSIVAWSLFCGLTATAWNTTSLLVLRVFFGAAEGPFGSTSAKIVSQCFPKREVSSSIALGASGTPIGAVVAGPLVALLVAQEGWRVALAIVASLGLVFAVAWARFGTAWTEAAQENSGLSRPATALTPERTEVRRRLLWQPVLVANALAYFAYTYLLSLFLSWLPTFFMSRYHLDLRAAAFSASAPWIMAFVGLWAGALLTDVLFRRTNRLLWSRWLPQVGGLAIAAVGTALLAEASTATGAMAVGAVALFALFATGTSFWAVVQDVVPVERVGRASGLTHLIANLGGVVGPAVTGAIVQHTASFRLAWWVAAGLCLAAVVGVVTAASFAAPGLSSRE